MSPIVGLGIDLVDVERFARVIARRPNLITRLFSDREVADARGRAESLAGRFAAKEATMKALGVGLGAFKLRDVEVIKARSGAPTLRLTGAAAELAAARGADHWVMTMTHTATTAAVVAIAEST
jgi:holo-[acyl-carrier protein] synthase